MVNKVTLIGNLGKDPEVRHLENGASVARFSLATNESYKDKAGEWQNRTEWHVVVVWRALADQAERLLKKGSMVYVEGKLRTRSYQDSNGVEKQITEVEGQYMRSLDKRERNDSSFPTAQDDPSNTYGINSATPSSTTATPATPQVTQTPQQPSSPGADAASMEDDLPF